MRLSLLKDELKKKKLKLEKQKRYASSRKKRLELANSSNKNGIEKSSRSRKSSKNVKFDNDVTIVPEVKSSQLFAENIDNSEIFKAQKHCLSIETRPSDTDFTSGGVDILMISESIGDDSKTFFTEQNNQLNSFEKNVSKDVGLCVSDDISERNEISLQSNIEIHEVNKYKELLVQVNNVFNTDLNYRLRDLQNMTDEFKIDLQTETVTLSSENGIVLFCDYFDETLVVRQQNMLSIYSMNLDGNWFVVHEYIRKVNWFFRDGYFNTDDNSFNELNENQEYSGFVGFLLLVYKTKKCWEEREIMLCTLPR